MGLFSNLFNNIGLGSDEEDEPIDDDLFEQPSKKHFPIFGNKEDIEDDEFTLKRLNNSRKSMEVTVLKPNKLDDGKEICDCLLEGKTVIINMEGVHTDMAQRIVDFTSGATYSIDGRLQKISNYLFVATPKNVDLTGDFSNLINSGTFDISGSTFKF